MIDLDLLDALERQATPGEWTRGRPPFESDDIVAPEGTVFTGEPTNEGNHSLSATDEDRDFVIALRNAYKEMAAEIRTLRAQVGDTSRCADTETENLETR